MSCDAGFSTGTLKKLNGLSLLTPDRDPYVASSASMQLLELAHSQSMCNKKCFKKL